MRAGVPLALEHEAEIEAALAPLRARLGYACLSEYAFSNLYLFRHAHAYRYLPGPWPAVSGLTYDGKRHLLPLFDPLTAPRTVWDELLHGHDFLFPLPDCIADALDPQRFTITCSADDADYLYPARNFREYRGEQLRKKRQLMQQLLRDTQVSALPLNAARIDDACRLVAGWMRDKEKTAGEADEQASLEALELAQRFGLDGWIYTADGEPAGFLLAQRVNPETAVMRFAKGSDRYKGIYQYMFHHYCMQAPTLEWLNFEQDMGLPNFRQTKRSYQPHTLLDKFRASLRD